MRHWHKVASIAWPVQSTRSPRLELVELRWLPTLALQRRREGGNERLAPKVSGGHGPKPELLQCSFAGFLLVISFGIYPSGWGSETVQQACGKKADFYEIGHCRLGWAFFIFVIAISLAFICAGLSLRAGKKSANRDYDQVASSFL